MRFFPRAFLLSLAILSSWQVSAAPRLPEETPYTVLIEQAIDIVPMGRGDSVNLTLQLATEVPNSPATVLLRGVTSAGGDVLMQVSPVYNTPGHVVQGKPTRYLRLQFSPKEKGFTVERLNGAILQLVSLPLERQVVDVKDLGALFGRPLHSADITFDSFVPNTISTLVVDLGAGAVRKTIAPNYRATKTIATTTLQGQAQWTAEELAALVGKTVRVYSPQLPEVK